MSEDQSPAVVANIRAELARRGLRQGDLARIWGISEMSVSRRMTGKTPISYYEIATAAAALEVEVMDLLPSAAAS